MTNYNGLYVLEENIKIDKTRDSVKITLSFSKEAIEKLQKMAP